MIVNIEFAMALLGILLMLLETELYIRGVVTKSVVVCMELELVSLMLFVNL